MAIRKKQHPAQTPASIPPARPACRQRADSIRRKAQRYTDLSEQTGKQNHDQCKASQKRERAEREMAALRAEAVQARRLASRIKNLHQPAQAKPEGRTMSTTIADPGQAQRMRRGTDRPLPTGRQLSFNPLHPSMELPPEHLIRLLGLENKAKRRKKRPASVTTHRREEKKSDSTTTVGKPVTPARVETPPASTEQERNTTPPFGEPRRNLLVTSLIVGIIAGAVLSVFLFWSSPDNATRAVTQTVPTPAVNNPLLPTPAAMDSTLPTAASTAPATETSRQGTVKRSDTISAAAISTEEKRLRNEAEKRFTERMLQQETRRELEIPDRTETTPNVTAETSITMEPEITTTAPVEPAVIPENPARKSVDEALF